MEFLIYQLKVGALIALFYMCYRLFLANETLHRLNRAVLLLTAALSLVLPFCVITMHRTVIVPVLSAAMVASVSGGVTAVQATTPVWVLIANMVFWTGFALTLGYTVVSIVRVVRMIRRGERHPQQDGTVIVVTDREMRPSSWMKYILLSRADYEHQDAAILAHERGHVAARHSWDVLFTDVLTAFQWFNPVIWMLRSDLCAIHEYEADAAVLQQGINARQYQYLLIREAIGGSGYSVANGFSHSALKNRITMMLKSQSPRMRSWKALFVLPIAALALVTNAKTVTDYRTLARQPSALAVQEAAKALPEVAALPSDTSVAKPTKGGQDKKVVYYLNGVRQQNGDAVKALKPDLIKSVDVIGSDQGRETMVNAVTKDFDESKAPKVKVQGKVVDENGQVVIGAIVKRSGTNIGTVTGPRR